MHSVRNTALRCAAYARTLLLAVGLLCALPSSARAQDEISFDVIEHLDGYEAALESKFADLYPLEEFERYHGTTVTAAELKEIQQRWIEAYSAAKERASAMAADPSGLFRTRFEQKVGGHSYLPKIPHDVVDSVPGFVFVVQRLPGRSAADSEELAREYAALVRPVQAIFEDRFLDGTGIPRKEDYPVFAMVVLATRDDFLRFNSTNGFGRHYDEGASWDEKLEAAVVYDQHPDDASRTASARHAFTHALQNAWYGGRGDVPHSGWLFEGLAEYFARRPARARNGFAPDADEVARFLTDASDANARATSYRRVSEFVDVAEAYKFPRVLETRGLDVVEPDGFWEAWSAFNRQASLLVHFLAEGAEGSFGEGLATYVGEVLRGRRGDRAFLASFGGAAVSEIDTAFLDWVVAAGANVTFDDQVLRGASGLDLTTSELFASAIGSGGVADASFFASPGAVPRKLGDARPDERIAMAIWAVRTGRAHAALTTLEQVMVELGGGGMHARAEREFGRVRAWIALRDEFLNHLAATKGTLQYEVDGKKGKATVEGFDGVNVKLGSNRQKLESLPAEELPALDLAKQMAKVADGWAEPAVLVYPYVIGGDKKWSRMIDEDDAASVALRADGEGDYEGYLRVGELCARLAALLDGTDPTSAKEAKAQLQAIEDFREENASVPLVKRKEKMLRKRAEEVAGRLFDLEGPGDALAGAFKAKKGGFTLTYGFDAKEELGDFELDANYLDSDHASYPALPASTLGEFYVRDGALVGRGATCLRGPVDFAAPFRVSYTVSFAAARSGAPAPELVVGACDDSAGGFVRVAGLGALEIRDGRAPGEIAIEARTPDRVYAIELVHDGAKVTTLVDGVETASEPCELREGGLVLWVHAGVEVRIDALAIEGTEVAGSYDRLRDAWVERRLGE